MAKDLNLSVTLSAINKATGPLRKIMDGSRGAGRAIRETNDQLNDLKGQQKNLSSFRNLSKQSYETRDALREKREELKKVSENLATTTGPTRRLEQQQRRAKEEVEKLSGQYRNQRERVRELARELPPGIEGTRGFKEQNAALEEQIRETNNRLSAQKDALSRLGKADVSGKFRNMTAEIGKLATRVTMLGGAAAGGIFALANSTASLGDDVAKTSAKLGITSQELQELRYAAERSDVSTSTLDSSMVAFVKRLGEASQGTGAAVKGYEALGLSAEELSKMSPAAAMEIVADRMAAIENPVDRATIASQLYSRAGVGLVNMLKDGSEGLRQYGKDARDTGYMLSDTASKDSEAFKDALLDAQLGLKGMKNTIGAELIPAITDMMKNLSGWMRENRDRVKEFARTFGERLKDALPVILDIARGAAKFAGTLGDMVSTAARLAGGFDNLAIIAGTLFAGKAIVSVISFATAIGSAGAALGSFAMTFPKVAAGVKILSAAFAATPIGWLVVGITAVAAGAIYLWRNWETIGPKFKALWESMKQWPGQAWENIKNAFSNGIGGVAKLLLDWSPLGLIWRGITAALSALGVDVPEGFTTLGGALVDGLIGGISNALGWARDAITGLGSSIMGWFKGALGINSPSTVFAGFGGNLLDGLVSGIDKKWQMVKDKIGATASAVTGWFKDKLGINSPSKVFAEFGVNTMQGYNQGIEGGADEPIREVGQFAKRLKQAGAGLALGAAATAGATTPASLSDSIGVDMPALGSVPIDTRAPVSATAGSGITINGGINISVPPTPGMDEQALARYVGAEVQRALAEAQRDASVRRRSAFYDTD